MELFHHLKENKKVKIYSAILLLILIFLIFKYYNNYKNLKENYIQYELTCSLSSQINIFLDMLYYEKKIDNLMFKNFTTNLNYNNFLVTLKKYDERIKYLVGLLNTTNLKDTISYNKIIELYGLYSQLFSIILPDKYENSFSYTCDLVKIKNDSIRLNNEILIMIK